MIQASIALGLVVVMNLIATAMLIRSDFESRFQKTAQFLLIWILPVVGAILVIGVLTNSRGLRKPRSGDAGSGASLFPGSDGDLNRDGVNHGGPWGESGHDGHVGDGGHGGP